MKELITYHYFGHGSPRTEIPSDCISLTYYKLLILNKDMKL